MDIQFILYCITLFIGFIYSISGIFLKKMLYIIIGIVFILGIIYCCNSMVSNKTNMLYNVQKSIEMLRLERVV